MNYVIIGSSAAGLKGLEAIKAGDPGAEITVVTADQNPPHSRILTSYLLGGEIPDEYVYIRNCDYFEEIGVNLIAEDRVTRVDPDSRTLKLASGRQLEYDKLLIATGASSKLPDYPGHGLKGVFTFRDLNDVRTIQEYLDEGVTRCIMFGGGLVSMKAAEAFYQQGREVAFIIHSPQVLSQMVDKKAADIVENYLVTRGFKFYEGESVKEILGQQRVTGVKTESGLEVSGQLVVVGKGVKPNYDFLDPGQFELSSEGIVVDEYLQTSVENVYAAGDVAEAGDYLTEGTTNNAIWPEAVFQGKVAGQNMTGKQVKYEGELSLNALKVLGKKVFTVGKVKIYPEEAGDYNVYTRYLPEQGIYRKLVFQQGVMVGAVALGETEDIGVLRCLIKDRAEVEDRAQRLVRHGLDYADIIKDNALRAVVNCDRVYA
ncbi:MAG: NAD(P)/FAD-dependent oxidoreductase [Bacillota bacterium]